MDHVRQDGGAQTLDPRHRIRFAASAVPLPFEWFQEVIEQTRKSLHHASGLRRTEVFDFLEREQRVSGFNNPIAEQQMALRLQDSRVSISCKTGVMAAARSPSKK